MYKVYVRVDENNRIIEINSSEFIKDKDLEGWTQIDAGEGDKYHHAQGNYFDKPILNEYGMPVYRLADGKAVERTAEEIQADTDALPPSPPTLEQRVVTVEETLESASIHEMRRASEQFAQSIAKSGSSDYSLMEIANLYPSYESFVKSGEKIIADEVKVIRHGLNAVGDPQLYRVILDTIPRADLTPDKVATSFMPIGLGKSGYPIWIQPLWHLDAYNLNDIVDVDGVAKISTKDGNMDNPESEGAAWDNLPRDKV